MAFQKRDVNRGAKAGGSDVKSQRRDFASGFDVEKKEFLPTVGVGRVCSNAAPSSLFWSRFDASGA